MNIYTGIGSRETPLDILILMSKLANILEKKGFKLRSGAALGADSAFEFGVENPLLNAEIFTISRDSRKSHPYKVNTDFFVPKLDNYEGFLKASKIISFNNIHEHWDKKLDQSARELHNRNIFQVLGKKLIDHPVNNEKSRFLFCYTTDGAKTSDETSMQTGGTRTAIRTANLFKVPVYNFGNIKDREKITDFINQNSHLINNDHINNIVLYSKFNPKKKTIKELLEEPKNNMPKRRRYSF